MKKSTLREIVKNELLKEGFSGFGGVVGLGPIGAPMKSLTETEEPDYGAAGSKDIGEAGEEDYEDFMDAINDINESEEGNSKILASKISDAIQSVDESLSYTDLADAVASILRDQYGKHNFNPFIQRLSSKL